MSLKISCYVKRKALITCQSMPKILIPQLIIEFWILLKPTHKVLSLITCTKTMNKFNTWNLSLSVKKMAVPKSGWTLLTHGHQQQFDWLFIVALIWLVWAYIYTSLSSLIDWSNEPMIKNLPVSTLQTTESGMNLELRIIV